MRRGTRTPPLREATRSSRCRRSPPGSTRRSTASGRRPTIRARSSRCSVRATRCTCRSRGRTSAPTSSATARRKAPTKAGSASSSRRSRPSSDTSRSRTRSGSGSRARAKAAPLSRSGQVETFTEEIEPADGPVLHFLHVLLPHKAWRYLPSGAMYSDTVGADAELGGLEEWYRRRVAGAPGRAALPPPAPVHRRTARRSSRQAARRGPLRRFADRRRGRPRRRLPSRGRAP